MKTIFKVLVGAAFATMLASCSHKQEFYTDSYARLGGTSYEVLENAGVCRIPVNSYNCDGKTGTVMFAVTDGKAVQGVDYNIEPASGVININGNGTAFIDVIPIAHIGELTGDLDFSIALTGATGVDLGSTVNVAITIKDTDHPLTKMFGAYTMGALTYDTESSTYLSYVTWTMNMSAYPGDVTRVTMDNICPFGGAWYKAYGPFPVYGIVSDDHKTITVPLPQETQGTLSTAWGLNENAYMYAHAGVSGGYIESASQVVFTLDEATGNYVADSDYGFTSANMVGDYNIWYEGCVCFSTYSASTPTYFVKQ